MDRSSYKVTRKTFYFWSCHAKLPRSCRLLIAMQKMGQAFDGKIFRARGEMKVAAVLVKGVLYDFNDLREKKYFRYWTAAEAIVRI